MRKHLLIALTLVSLILPTVPAHAADLDVNLDANTGMFSVLNFTFVTIGNEKTGTISITNKSANEIELTPILGGGTEETEPGQFTLKTPEDTTLSPNENLTLEVTLAPNSLGHKSAWVKLSDKAPYDKFLEFYASALEDTGEGYYLYEAEPGDTFSYIAERFVMKKSDLLESNNITELSNLRSGDILKIYKSQIGISNFGVKPTVETETAALIPKISKEKQAEYPAVEDSQNCAPIGDTSSGSESILAKEFGMLPVEIGVLDCKPNTADYRLSDPINRAEAAKILFILKYFSLRPDLTPSERSEIKKGNYVVEFSRNFEPQTYQDGLYVDVPSGEWYADYIQTLTKWGVVNGDAGLQTFRPGSKINNAESLKLIVSAYLSGGLYDLGNQILSGAELQNNPEQKDYFFKNFQQNITNIKQQFNNVNEQAWYITFLAKGDSIGIGSHGYKAWTNSSQLAVGDQTTRAEFLLWALRSYTANRTTLIDKRARFLVDTNKNFQMLRDNVRLTNTNVKITLGDMIHAYDLQYVLPSDDPKYQNKRYFFENEEVFVDHYKINENTFDYEKFKNLANEISLRTRRGEELNYDRFLKKWANLEFGANCSGFSELTARWFNGYTQFKDSITSVSRNNTYEIQENDFDLRPLVYADSTRRDYMIKMQDLVRIQWIRGTISSQSNHPDYLTPKEFVSAYQSFFDRYPEMDPAQGFHFIPYTNSIKLANGGHSVLVYSYHQDQNQHFFGVYDSNYPADTNRYFQITDDGTDTWHVEFVKETSPGQYDPAYNQPGGGISNQKIGITTVETLGTNAFNLPNELVTR